MANQSPDRRRVLEMLATAAAIGQFPGFCRWMSAAEEHQHTGQVAVPRTGDYKPQFFSSAEYRVLDQVTELIIPRDESPGARDAGVSEFIDFMAAHDPDLQAPFRKGIAWLNATAKRERGQEFAELDAGGQTKILERLAYGEKQVASEAEAQAFFKLLRTYTVMGYYTSRIGLEELNYPGLKLYSASPECPHAGDPEHKHLPAGI